jgi:hypothetical protein
MSTFNLKTITKMAQNGISVFVVGLHGTGKTSILLEAAKEAGFNNIVYRHCPTMEPIIDLVGIPITQDGEVKFCRPNDIQNAECIIFDEPNRAADDSVINRIMEIIQFGTVNGEKLPNLKWIACACNPDDDDYNVSSLDKAFLDRFGVFMKSEPNIDIPYFTDLFGTLVAQTVSRLWNTYEQVRKDQKTKNDKWDFISPRRMETVVRNFQIIGTNSIISDSLNGLNTPYSSALWAKKWGDQLKDAFDGKESTDDSRTDGACDDAISEQMSLSDSDFRSQKNIENVCNIFRTRDISECKQLIDRLSKSWVKGYSKQRLENTWLRSLMDCIDDLGTLQRIFEYPMNLIYKWNDGRWLNKFNARLAVSPWSVAKIEKFGDKANRFGHDVKNKYGKTLYNA